jgi:hypothetical protein
MAVNVELLGQLSRGKPRRQVLTLEEPMTVRAIAVRVGLDPDEIGLVSIDGVLTDLEDALPAGSRWCFFRLVSGG